MRPLYGCLLLLTACAATPAERFKAERPKHSSKAQGDLLKRTMALYWGGGADYRAAVDECAKDPDVAKALAMLMVVKMDDTERLQRERQGTDFQLRTLEQNIPYTRARSTIVRLGELAMPIVEELIRHQHTDTRLRGVEILSRMPDAVLPALRERFAACPVRYRRHYVEAVGRMQASPKVELQLLEWSRAEDVFVRAAALAGLAEIGDRHLPLLRDTVTKDPDHFVRREIIKRLGGFPDRATVAAVVGFYADCAARGDRRGIREAERTLIKMSKSPPTKGGRLIHYGLAHWQKWVLTLPADGGKR